MFLLPKLVIMRSGREPRLAICVVGNERAFINSVLDKIINYIEVLNRAEMIDHNDSDRELFIAR